eukprot:CAMPEP_0175052246 /NCGR_PEP_ID=MMETSP0052_2-20121109/8254_1 /TAXON_ID=51329 ORGANISM="Polytomella parva, Strain SAG 63-3" /NCGR_SAMPLE_ID=MMETSP0052_2 /ASSEMBLY_ACC=CAM_ASM_000194 /LENGTH=108 /DNA_ID=CAMNT_0016316631 /DNA_START=963 /DNA_END=1289 /DNA_ORIENTATION=-
MARNAPRHASASRSRIQVAARAIVRSYSSNDDDDDDDDGDDGDEVKDDDKGEGMETRYRTAAQTPVSPFRSAAAPRGDARVFIFRMSNGSRSSIDNSGSAEFSPSFLF